MQTVSQGPSDPPTPTFHSPSQWGLGESGLLEGDVARVFLGKVEKNQYKAWWLEVVDSNK